MHLFLHLRQRHLLDALVAPAFVQDAKEAVQEVVVVAVLAAVLVALDVLSIVLGQLSNYPRLHQDEHFNEDLTIGIQFITMQPLYCFALYLL